MALEREYTGVEIVTHQPDVTRRMNTDDNVNAEAIDENRSEPDAGGLWLDVYAYDERGEELSVETSESFSVPSNIREELSVRP